MTQKKLLKAKKEYIYWFLTTHSLKWPHISKLLYFIYNYDSLLEQIGFTKYLNNRPNTLLISAEGSKTFPFICKLNGKFYSDIDQIMHILQHYPPEKLLCRLSIPVIPACAFCSQPRPMRIGRQIKNKRNKFLLPQTSFDQDNRLLLLSKAIDEALDNRNKSDFYRYSQELKALLNKKVSH